MRRRGPQSQPPEPPADGRHASAASATRCMHDESLSCRYGYGGTWLPNFTSSHDVSVIFSTLQRPSFPSRLGFIILLVRAVQCPTGFTDTQVTIDRAVKFADDSLQVEQATVHRTVRHAGRCGAAVVVREVICVETEPRLKQQCTPVHRARCRRFGQPEGAVPSACPPLSYCIGRPLTRAALRFRRKKNTRYESTATKTSLLH